MSQAPFILTSAAPEMLVALVPHPPHPTPPHPHFLPLPRCSPEATTHTSRIAMCVHGQGLKIIPRSNRIAGEHTATSPCCQLGTAEHCLLAGGSARQPRWREATPPWHCCASTTRLLDLWSGAAAAHPPAASRQPPAGHASRCSAARTPPPPPGRRRQSLRQQAAKEWHGCKLLLACTRTLLATDIEGGRQQTL